MSVNLNALKQYQSVDLRATVASASPHKLIEMLLDGALAALAKAKGSMEREEIETRTAHINKATEIVVNLQGLLDGEQGGEVAENLDALYDYMIRSMMEGNRDNNIDKVSEVIALLVEIRQGWGQMPEELK